MDADNSLSFKISGTKERIYGIRDESELESVQCNFKIQLIFYIS
jgi:hypothetical protein